MIRSSQSHHVYRSVFTATHVDMEQAPARNVKGWIQGSASSSMGPGHGQLGPSACQPLPAAPGLALACLPVARSAAVPALPAKPRPCPSQPGHKRNRPSGRPHVTNKLAKKAGHASFTSASAPMEYPSYVLMSQGLRTYTACGLIDSSNHGAQDNRHTVEPFAQVSSSSVLGVGGSGGLKRELNGCEVHPGLKRMRFKQKPSEARLSYFAVCLGSDEHGEAEVGTGPAAINNVSSLPHLFPPSIPRPPKKDEA